MFFEFSPSSFVSFTKLNNEEAGLLEVDQEDSADAALSKSAFCEKERLDRRSSVFLRLSCGINVILILVIAMVSFKSAGPHKSTLDMLYSPARNLVEYEIISFPESTQNKSEYQPDPTTGIPTDETDRLWDDLYLFGMQTWIDGSTAKKLPNRTLALPGDPSKFVIQLDVFHQLHCLNVLRGLLWPERYKDKPHTNYFLPNGERNYTSSAAKHYDHCLEYLRKSVMCHSDISVVYYDYTEGDHSPSPHELEPHVCRNFEKIQDWAKERQLEPLSWPTNWLGRRPPESAYSVLEN